MAITFDPSMVSVPIPQGLSFSPTNTGSGMDILGAAGGVASSLIGGITGAIQNRKNRKFQQQMQANQNAFTERMWNQQNDWNLAQWNRQNEYNAPESQVQRALDAGINPNSIAGGIAGNGAGQASAVQADSVAGAGASGQGVAVPLGGIGNSLIENIIGMAQKKNIEADTALKEKQAGKVESETYLTNAQCDEVRARWKAQLFENENMLPLRKAELEKIIDNLTKEGALTDAKVKEVGELINTYVQQIAESKTRQANLEKDIEVKKAQVALLKEQVRTEMSTQARNAAAADLDRAQSDLASAEAALTDEKTAAQGLANDFESNLQYIGLTTPMVTNGTGVGLYESKHFVTKTTDDIKGRSSGGTTARHGRNYGTRTNLQWRPKNATPFYR